MTSRLRPAHGVAMLFLANGLTHPSLWPRLPEIRDAVGATDATFGLALLGTGIGGVAGSIVAPALTRRLGTGPAASLSAAMLAVVTITAALAGNVAALFAAFAMMGLTDGVADISQNALMFDVQRAGDRSLASRMHAVWSVGALGGTAIGTFAAAVGVSLVVQTTALAVLGIGLTVAARAPVRRLPSSLRVRDEPAAAADVLADVTGSEVRSRPPLRVRAWALVVVAGVVVAAVEAVANEWSALTLRNGLGASVAVAGLGPTAFAGAMLVGRLIGDRAIDRFGVRRVARLGAGAVVGGSGLGLALAAWLDVPALLIAGLLAAGVGAATLFPLMLAAGDRLDATGRGVAVASLSARSGFLAVPVTVGLISDRAGPTIAFALLPLAGLIAALVLPSALGREQPAS